MGRCPLTLVEGHATIGKCFLVFRIRDYPSAESRSSSQILIFYILKYSVGRQDASAIGYSTLTAVVMLASIGNCTLSADRVFPQLDGVL